MTIIRPFPTPLDHPVRLAVLISGSGTTLVNLHDKIQSLELQAEIAVVIASRRGCGGIEKALSRGLACEVIARKEFAEIQSFSDAVSQQCRAVKADLIICGGFLSLLKIPEDYRYRILNIHPSLIPAFCGTGFHGEKVHQAVLDRGCKVSGCTVHFLDDEYDHGPIILQRTVPVLDGDTASTLGTRVFQAECQAYPDAIQQVASGLVEIIDGVTRLVSAR